VIMSAVGGVVLGPDAVADADAAVDPEATVGPDAAPDSDAAVDPDAAVNPDAAVGPHAAADPIDAAAPAARGAPATPAPATAMSFDKATATKASTPLRNTFFNVTPSPTTRGTKPKRATQVFLFVLAAYRPPERIVYSGPRHRTH
jgi:hypothetical protein